jgi:hypothetical protein
VVCLVTRRAHPRHLASTAAAPAPAARAAAAPAAAARRADANTLKLTCPAECCSHFPPFGYASHSGAFSKDQSPVAIHLSDTSLTAPTPQPPPPTAALVQKIQFTSASSSTTPDRAALLLRDVAYRSFLSSGGDCRVGINAQ